jgi:hypothetical protein
MQAGSTSTTPAPLSASAERAIRELSRHTGAAWLEAVHGDDLLMERARLLGLRFTPGCSAGGCCRLLKARGGVVAVNLARDSDWELLPAWLEADVDTSWTWDTLTEIFRSKPADVLLDRARLLGIPMARAVPPATSSPPFYRLGGHGRPLDVARGTRPTRPRPRVVDLSALWAGPLCTHLLHLCGADVIKVEDLCRPDGARDGNKAFYGLLNQGKRCVALDLRQPTGWRTLRTLIEGADIVIESSRPRALRQMGLDAEALIHEHPALTWVSITGYGREEPQASWVAFGDDAGVAAGLADVMRKATGEFQFAGDAIADPLTGVQAALVSWRSWQTGGDRLIVLSLVDVAAASLEQEIRHRGEARVTQSFRDWWTDVRGRQLASAEPPRRVTEHVGALGEHTGSVLSELGASC